MSEISKPELSFVFLDMRLKLLQIAVPFLTNAGEHLTLKQPLLYWSFVLQFFNNYETTVFLGVVPFSTSAGKSTDSR